MYLKYFLLIIYIFPLSQTAIPIAQYLNLNSRQILYKLTIFENVRNFGKKDPEERVIATLAKSGCILFLKSERIDFTVYTPSSWEYLLFRRYLLRIIHFTVNPDEDEIYYGLYMNKIQIPGDFYINIVLYDESMEIPGEETNIKYYKYWNFKLFFFKENSFYTYCQTCQDLKMKNIKMPVKERARSKFSSLIFHAKSLHSNGHLTPVDLYSRHFGQVINTKLPDHYYPSKPAFVFYGHLLQRFNYSEGNRYTPGTIRDAKNLEMIFSWETNLRFRSFVFTPVQELSSSLVYCQAELKFETFKWRFLVAPFDLYIWLAIFLSIWFFSFLEFLCNPHRPLQIYFLQILLFLLKQSGAKKFRLHLLGWAFSCILLSHYYETFITSTSILPFAPITYDTNKKLFAAGYK